MTIVRDLSWVLDTVPWGVVLREAGFRPVPAPGQPDEFVLAYPGAPGAFDDLIPGGRPAALYAWPETTGGGEVTGWYVGTRAFDLQHRLCRIHDPSPRGYGLTVLASAWQRAASGQRPPPLWVGCSTVWANHMAMLDRLNHGLPRMEIDGWVLGGVLRRLRQEARHDPQATIKFGAHCGTCLMWIGKATYASPVRNANWHVMVRCSAAEFIDAMPRRLPQWLALSFDPPVLTVAEDATILADWGDPLQP